MFKNIIRIVTIVCLCMLISNAYGKDYGTVNKMVVTAETNSLGSVTMAYNLDITLNSNLTEEIDSFEIPMLSENFKCIYYTKNIASVQKVDDHIIIKTSVKHKAGDKFNLAFKVNYTKFYTLNGKNEAVYKFKFDKIEGYKVDQARLRWKVGNNTYANYTDKDGTYRYWNLGSLGMLSKEVVVKYEAKENSFPKSNSRPKSIRDFLLGGGAFLLIFLGVLITNIIPNDSYSKNSGFGFNVKVESIE